MRNKFLFLTVAILTMLSLIAPAALVSANMTWAPDLAPPGQTPMVAADIPQFQTQLPKLSAAGGTIQTVIAGTSQIEFDMKEFKANMLPSTSTFLPDYTGTYVWGYINPNDPYYNPNAVRDTYTGGVVVATRGVPSEFKFVNMLGTTDTTQIKAYLAATDQSLHWANPNNEMRYVANPFTPADPPWLGNPDHYSGAIPAAVHLHGAEDPAAIDGGPDSWFTSAGQHGPSFYSKDIATNTNGNYCIYRYPNVQEAAPLWFHDHTLGATRLNVYMGLAGAYALIDPNLVLPAGLGPIGLTRTIGANAADDTLIPLVVQDRMFDTTGQLYFPAGPGQDIDPSPNPEHAYWTPEFFGEAPNIHDTICVNGKVWPNLDVKAERYRFFMINGSNARSYILSFKDSLSVAPGYTAGHTNTATPTIWQIGTDQGYLDNPVAVDPLIIMPGERAEFIIDFGGLSAGTKLVLNNFGPDAPLSSLPVPTADFNDAATTGTVMQFTVTNGAVSPDTSFNPAAPGATIRTGGQKIVRLVDPATGTLANKVQPILTRELTLNEIARDAAITVDPNGASISYGGGPLEILVNNTKWTGRQPDESDPNNMNTPADQSGWYLDGMATMMFDGNYISETPQEGTTEVWEIVNLTMDAHPIHTHLAQFQLMNRQRFQGDLDTLSGGYYQAYAASFTGGSFIPAIGPPKGYKPGDNALSGGKYGGNPDITSYLKTGAGNFLLGTGNFYTPLPNEAGWKDTVMCPPGMVTRFVVRWAPTDIGIPANSKALRYAFLPNDTFTRVNPRTGQTITATYDYVWHCHIVDHEDNEMMRPDVVIPNPDTPTRGYRMGRDY